MLKRILAVLVLLLPLNAMAVYFPSGIDWTNPSVGSFVQSLYLNVLGRAPSRQESEDQIRNLRRNDNRTARLRVFETMIGSSEYQRTFSRQGNWRVYRAPDYNYQTQYGQRGDGFWRFKAAENTPEGFRNIAGNSRVFSQSVAHSVAHYYDAFCYSGETCIDNPELARDRNPGTSFTTTAAHACADPSNQTSQFKWVAVNGTTYPRGIDRKTVCLQDHYYQAEQLTLQRYDCDRGFTNCERNRQLDLRATRSGTDNSGNTSLFFRDGSRLALINTDTATDHTSVATNSNSDAVLLGNSHACANTRLTTSRFLWEDSSRRSTTNGIGSDVICMDNYYYEVEGLNLVRFQCQQGFTDCRPDPRNNLQAERRTRVNGNAGLLFANGSTVSMTLRGAATTGRDTSRDTTRVPANTTGSSRPPQNTGSQLRTGQGSDCADPTLRVSQFRWKSDGLSSWPDGVGGRFICLSNSYYEISQNKLSHYVCQSNYRGCRANPGKDLRISQVNSDGTVRTLSNGDEVTLVSR